MEVLPLLSLLHKTHPISKDFHEAPHEMPLVYLSPTAEALKYMVKRTFHQVSLKHRSLGPLQLLFSLSGKLLPLGWLASPLP
jgi:hypothetical protein